MTRPGQLEELGFDSRDEAVEYVQRQIRQADPAAPTAATLIDPQGSRTVILLSEDPIQQEERTAASA